MNDGQAQPVAGTEQDGASRRGLLKCMAWAGAGVLWTVSGGVPRSRMIGAAEAATSQAGTFSFMQISDSHIGFSNAPNTDVTGTLREAVDLVNAQKGERGAADPYRRRQPAVEGRAVRHGRPDHPRAPSLTRITCRASTTCWSMTASGFFDRFTPGAPQGWYSLRPGRRAFRRR